MNIIDWVNRAEEPVNASNYTDTDAAVLSQMAYFKFENLNINGDMTIGRLMDEYLPFCQSSDEYNLAIALRDSPRYSSLVITDFTAKFSEVNSEQFAALSVRIPGGGNAVVFRGTDGTATGWYEDFLLLSEEQAAAQRDALEYLERIAAENPGSRLFVSGHSKGGMLADYAVIAADDSVQDRIDRVVNLDGPGLYWDVNDTFREDYEQMKDRMQTYAPEDSVIGQLLEDHENQTFVKSDENFIFQHDLYSWQFNEDGSYQEGTRTERSVFLNEVLDRTVKDMPEDQRRNFVNAVFLFVFKGNPYGGTDMAKDFIDDWNDGRYLDLALDIVDTFHDMTLEEREAFAVTLAQVLIVAAQEGLDEFLSDHPVLEKIVHTAVNTVNGAFDRLDQWLESTPAGKALKNGFREIRDWCLDKINTAVEAIRKIGYAITHPFQNFDPGDTLRLDIPMIRSVALQLQYIQRRIEDVDDEMNSLRRNQEWYEIFNKAAIGSIDFLFVGYDRDIRDCTNYLNRLADMYDDCEQQLRSMAEQF